MSKEIELKLVFDVERNLGKDNKKKRKNINELINNIFVPLIGKEINLMTVHRI